MKSGSLPKPTRRMKAQDGQMYSASPLEKDQNYYLNAIFLIHLFNIEKYTIFIKIV